MDLSTRQDASAELAAAASTPGWIVPLVIGVVVVAVLIGLVAWDSRRKRARAPRPDEQPRRPAHRAHIEEVREPDDFGADGERTLPHEMKGYGNMGSRSAPPGTHPDRDDKSGGSFGGGGLGS
ncbi:DUF6479 family protein [Streptomyces sp. DT24]|uniref:DUF6479 family protein n=1 Tax=unclassified Streptomyces TaxID=2593676 RepID=UPI0023B8A0AF|nr:DUF6479 family protein [Streptomyces sp. AM 4-1-1]WEH36673.1 DUF6479 family protein [Streptomyces sp. AM 4-1-1]